MKLRTASFSKKQYRAGQTMVEFALSAMLLLLLLFGIMEMGLAVYNYNTVSSAAREAVRYAIVHSPTSASPATTSQIQQLTINYAPALNLTPADISVSWPTDPHILPSQDDAQVTISYTYQFQIPFLSPVALKLTTTSQMLVSQ